MEGKTKDYEDPDMDTRLDCEVPTTEINDNCVNASIMLQRGKSYARGKVIVRKRDAYGNTVGRTNETP